MKFGTHSSNEKSSYRRWWHIGRHCLGLEYSKKSDRKLCFSLFYSEHFGINIGPLYLTWEPPHYWFRKLRFWLERKEPWCSIEFSLYIDRDGAWHRPVLYLTFIDKSKFVYLTPGWKTIETTDRSLGTRTINYRFKESSHNGKATASETEYVYRRNFTGSTRKFRRLNLDFDPPVGIENYKWYNAGAKPDRNGFNDAIHSVSVPWPYDETLDRAVERACDNSTRSRIKDD